MRTDEIMTQTPLTQLMFRKANKDKIPLSGTFELSPLCNFSCRMCYVKQTPEQVRQHTRKMMTLEQWMNLADCAEKAGMLYLLLTGGEPLLWPDFWKLYSYLSQKGFMISINTNFSMINEEAAAKFREMPPSRINITLYGASNETYRKLCGSSDGFERTDRAISLLKDAGIQVKLNCSLTPYNSQDLEQMVKYAEERKLILSVNTYMFPPLRKNPESIGINDRFTPEEAAYWNIRRLYLQRGEERCLEFLKRVAEGMAEPMGLDESCYDPADGKIRCQAGRASFWATWDGYMAPCGMLPKPKVDLMENDFHEAWEKLNSYTEKIVLSGICEKCNNRGICHSCAATAMAETGEFHKVSKYLCEMMEAMRKIAGEQLKIRSTDR